MINVTAGWGTTPIECAICGHKMQFVFETQIIKDGDTESWKLPKDVECPRCGSIDKMIFLDFENNNND